MALVYRHHMFSVISWQQIAKFTSSWAALPTQRGLLMIAGPDVSTYCSHRIETRHQGFLSSATLLWAIGLGIGSMLSLHRTYLRTGSAMKQINPSYPTSSAYWPHRLDTSKSDVRTCMTVFSPSFYVIIT